MREVLIITALPEEMEAVLNLLPNGRRDWKELRIEEGYSYYEAHIENGENTFLCKVTSQAQQGPIYASSHTTLMLQFKPDLLFMTGICAGNRNKGMGLGDVVLSDMAFHYETGKQTETGFHPEIECSNVDPVLVQWLKDYCWANDRNIEVNGEHYGLHVGAYATGSSVVSRNRIFDDLQVRDRNVLALDMEAYSVLKAVEISNKRIPTVVIKGVCDFADAQKDDNAHGIAAEIAARITLDIAKYLLERYPPKQPVPTNEVVYPIVLPRPAITYWHRVLWRSVLRWTEDNYSHFAKDYETGEIDENHEGSGLEFYALGNSKWLLEVVVGFGAYQGTYRYYFLDESGNQKSWKEVLFRQFSWNYSGEIRETLEPELGGIPTFDFETGLITTFVKGRGIGDYGSLSIYRFSDGETELLEYRHRDPDEEVDFENIPPPQEWDKIDISISYPKWTEDDE
jgi:nucleoside phosphorylase